MKIQFLNGGLANQVFQYIFYRLGQLANTTNDIWYLDDSFFFTHNVHNGYELERVFQLKPNLLSTAFDSDVWDAFIDNKKNGISIPQTLKDFGTDIIMYAETSNYQTFNPFNGKIISLYGVNEYHPDLLALDYPNIYYHGYWINKQYLNNCRNILLKELTFPTIPLASAREYANQIMTEPSVGVHIRRGDYVNIGWELPFEYYYDAIKELSDTYPQFTLFIFSDDLDWCEENANLLGFHLAPKCVYVRGNTGINSYLDMQLMSLCQGLILSRSSFSLLAGMLNQRLAFYLNPTDRNI